MATDAIAGSKARAVWGCALIAALTLVAYAPALRGGFIFDDDNILTKNAQVKAADGLWQLWFTGRSVDYWPVTMTSFWFEWRLWGSDPAGYHIVNVLGQVADALLLWAVLRRLSVPGSYAAALLFAVHPVNVQSVAWIAERKNVLCLFFYLLSILGFVKAMPPDGASRSRAGPRPGGQGFAGGGQVRYYLFSLAAFVLAMLSKGSVAFLPVVLLGIVAWRRRLGWRDVAWSAPFFAVAALFTWVNFQFRDHGLVAPIRVAGPVERLLEAGATVWFYLGKAVWPSGLTFVYPLWRIDPADWRWWLPLAGAIGVTVWLWRVGRAGLGRSALFAWLYFCVALIPVLGFADIYFMKFTLVADHYQYLALIGVTTAFAAGCFSLADAGGSAARIWRAAPYAVAVLLAFLAWRQAGQYRDAETLYRATLARNPSCWLADNNLGILEADSGRRAEARTLFERALALNPDYPEANFNYGLLLLAEPGGAAAAEPHFARAVRFRPDYGEARYYYANSLRELGRTDEAVGQYEAALHYQPDFPQAENNLGITLASAGRVGEALPHFEAAIRLAPGFAQAHLNLAFALRAQGRDAEAMQQFALAARLDPRLANPP